MVSGNGMVWVTVFLERSILTSLGPPGTTASVLGEAGSRTQEHILVVDDDALHANPSALGWTVFAPGDSPGTLTIRKNYYQIKDGTLTIEIAGKSNGKHDLLAVGGQPISTAPCAS